MGWGFYVVAGSLLSMVAMLGFMASAKRRYERDKERLGREPTESELCEPEEREEEQKGAALRLLLWLRSYGH